MSRVAHAALEAALNDEQPARRRSRFSGMTAVAAGAALVTATRVVAKKAPALLPHAPRLSDLTDNVRDRLAEHGWLEGEEPDQFEDGPLLDEEEDEPADEEEEEEPVDEQEGEPVDEVEWDESEDEGDDEDDEDDEWEDGDDDETDDGGPEASDDEDWDEEDEGEDEPDEEPEEEPAPSLEVGTNGGGREASARGTPDLMRSLSSHRRPPVMRSAERRLDPAEQPPEPPQRKQRSTKSKPKAKAGRKS